MTIKEFYDYVPSSGKSILSVISTSIMSSKWANVGAADISQLSNQIWFNNFSKELNPIIETYCELNNINITNMSTTNFQQIVKFLFLKYQDKWTKLWDYVYEQEYNPIWNVDGTETIVHTFEHGKTTTNTITSDVTQNSRNAFNTVTPKDTDRSSTTGSNTSADSGVDTERDTHTRGGNIGVTTTQQMLTSELEFRERFNYFVIVITDIVNELSLNIY